MKKFNGTHTKKKQAQITVWGRCSGVICHFSLSLELFTGLQCPRSPAPIPHLAAGHAHRPSSRVCPVTAHAPAAKAASGHVAIRNAHGYPHMHVYTCIQFICAYHIYI